MVGKSIAAYSADYDRGLYAASTDALLEALREHHDFDVRRPEGWKPAPKVTAPAAPEPPKRVDWFAFDDSNGPRIRDVQWAVADYYNVDVGDMLSARRTKNIVKPRHVAYYLCKKLTLKSYPEIGRRFGGRDHTTAISGIRKIETLRKTDEQLDSDIRTIASSLGGYVV